MNSKITVSAFENTPTPVRFAETSILNSPPFEEKSDCMNIFFSFFHYISCENFPSSAVLIVKRFLRFPTHAHEIICNGIPETSLSSWQISKWIFCSIFAVLQFKKSFMSTQELFIFRVDRTETESKTQVKFHTTNTT